MDELKELFGDGSLSYDDFEQKVAEKGFKLADLKTGKYVDKAKYDKLSGEYNDYKTNNDVAKYADYEDIKKERDELIAEKEQAQLIGLVTDAKVDEKFRKFVLAEVSAMVTDKKDFKSCLADYIKDNPQFVIDDTDNSKFFKRSTQYNMEQGGGRSENTTNAKFNKIIRGDRK